MNDCILPDKTNNVLSLQNTSNVIKPHEALYNLQVLLSELYPGSTKSEFCELTVSDLNVFGGKTTKSSNITLPDSTLYLVNFNNDNGFAILSAQTSLQFPVFCITESGNITSDDIENILNEFEEETTTKSSNTITSSQNDNFALKLIVSSVVNQLFHTPIMGNGSDLDTTFTEPDDGNYPPPPPSVPEPLPSIRRETIAKIGPLIETKWWQWYPFNTFLNNTNIPVGCVALATAQILAYNERNTSGESFNWDLLKTIYHYTNPRYSGSSDAKAHASDFLEFIGLPQNCDTDYDIEGSGAWASGAKRTLQNFGLQNVSKHFYYTDNNENKIINMILSGLPTYIDAQAPVDEDYSGHAWIIDGIYIYNTVNALNNTIISTDKLFHINWGWRGKSDGYYAQGIFDTTERNGYEVNYDSGEEADPMRFTWNYRIITYSLH